MVWARATTFEERAFHGLVVGEVAAILPVLEVAHLFSAAWATHELAVVVVREVVLVLVAALTVVETTANAAAASSAGVATMCVAELVVPSTLIWLPRTSLTAAVLESASALAAHAVARIASPSGHAAATTDCISSHVVRNAGIIISHLGLTVSELARVTHLAIAIVFEMATQLRLILGIHRLELVILTRWTAAHIMRTSLAPESVIERASLSANHMLGWATALSNWVLLTGVLLLLLLLVLLLLLLLYLLLLSLLLLRLSLDRWLLVLLRLHRILM